MKKRTPFLLFSSSFTGTIGRKISIKFFKHTSERLYSAIKGIRISDTKEFKNKLGCTNFYPSSIWNF